MKRKDIIKLLMQAGRLLSEETDDKITQLESLHTYTKLYGKEYECFRKALIASANNEVPNYLYYMKQGIEEGKKKKNHVIVSEMHLNLGIYYRIQGNLDEAFKQNVSALSAQKTARAYNNIADLYMAIKEPQLAIENLSLGEKLLVKMADEDMQKRMALVINMNFAEARLLSGVVQDAKSPALDVIAVAEETNDDLLKGHGYTLLGRVYTGLGDYENALKTHQKAFDAYERIFDKHRMQVASYISQSMFYVAKGYFNMNEFDKALFYLSQIKTKNESYFELRIACYERLLDYEAAYNVSKEFINYMISKKHQDLLQLKSTFQAAIKAMEVEERADEYEVLYETMKSLSKIGQQIIDSDRLEDAIETIYQQINDVMTSDSIMFGIVEEDYLDYQYIYEDGELIDGFKVSLDNSNSLGCWVVRNKDSILIRDAADYEVVKKYKDEPRVIYHGMTMESLILVPIMVKEHVYGVLSIQASQAYEYSDYEVEVIHTLASFMGIAMKNWQSKQTLELMNLQLSEISITDALTGIKNRRHLSEKVEELFSSDQSHEDVGIAIIDVDCFKEYNDNYGHLKGDDSLRKIAIVLRDILSDENELVFRYGGDEFVVLLKDANEQNIFTKLEATRQAIIDLNIKHEFSKIADHLTCTFGYTVVHRGHDYQSAFVTADEALYEAKAKGKNTIAFREGQIR